MNEWKANWIWDSPDPEGAQHRYFRKEICLPPKEIIKAIAYVSADEYYKLYINGGRVGQGPAPCFAEFQYYNTLDVARYLIPGKINALASHVMYSAVNDRGYTGGDNKMGFIMQLEIFYANGEKQIIITDKTWKNKPAPIEGAWWYEFFDGTKEPIGWKNPNFDDSSWNDVVELGIGPISGKWDRLIPQETEQIQFYEIFPQKFVDKGNGNYFIDFGKEAEGYLEVNFHNGKRDQIVKMFFAEEVKEGKEDEILYPPRWSWTWGDKRCERDYKMRGEEIEKYNYQYDYLGFRYVELKNSPFITANDVKMIIKTLYKPEDDYLSDFSCSSPILNQIYNLCKYTIKVGTEERYFDCPTRERGQYIGDGYIEVLTNFYAYNQILLTKKFLRNIAQDQVVTGNPVVRCVCPTGSSYQARILDYSLIWIFITWDYYMWTGDKEILLEMYPDIKKMLEIFYEDVFTNNRWDFSNSNLSEALSKGLVLWDWGAEFDCVPVYGNFPHYNTPVGDTLFYCFLYKALKATSRMAKELRNEKEKSEYDAKASKLKETINAKFWDEGYKNSMNDERKSLHANVVALYSEVVPENRKSIVINIIKNKGIYCGVYFAFFFFKVLYNENEEDYALSLLEAPYEGSENWQKRHRWSNMLAKGATTTWESWDPVEKKNMSCFHPWATAPVPIIAGEIIGIKPLEPGFEKILIKPRPSVIKNASITVPTIKGKINVSLANDSGRFLLNIDVPVNTTAKIYLPCFNIPEVSVEMDGTKTDGTREGNYVYVDNVKPGHHSFQMEKK